MFFPVNTFGGIAGQPAALRLYHVNSSLLDAVSGAKTLNEHSTPGFNTSEFKFGTASAGELVSQQLYYYDTVDAGSGDFNFGTGDFTMDIQIYVNTLPDGATNRGDAVLFGSGRLTGTNSDFLLQNNGEYMLGILGPAFGADTGKLIWSYKMGGSHQIFFSSNVVGTLEWIHVAIIRYGTTLYLTYNGVVVGSASIGVSDSLTGTTSFAIGGHSTTPPGNYPLSGYWDEMRIVKGTAAWTSFPFTVPTVEYLPAGP